MRPAFQTSIPIGTCAWWQRTRSAPASTKRLARSRWESHGYMADSTAQWSCFEHSAQGSWLRFASGQWALEVRDPQVASVENRLQGSEDGRRPAMPDRLLDVPAQDHVAGGQERCAGRAAAHVVGIDRRPEPHGPQRDPLQMAANSRGEYWHGRPPS